MKKDQWKEEELAEDYCFSCKDGGHLRVCDFKKCLKAYHPQCVSKDQTFLDDIDRWTCSLHTCSSCGKCSTYQCFCCPISYCRSCIKSAHYVQVKKRGKGFCINCLKLAKMIEEDRNINSDGEEVDFSNTDTYEFLFKDYWAIVRDQEGLTLVDVQAADALLKRGDSFQNESDSDKPFEEDSLSEPDDLEDDCDDESSPFKGYSGKRNRKKALINNSRRERTFRGWASEELVKFLASLGKDVTKPLTQVDVTEIVKDYVQSKNLFQPNKKRKNHVIPDEKLHSLFRKKKLKYHKIFDLLKGHLAEERSDLDDELSFGSDEDGDFIFAKKQRKATSEYKTPRSELSHYRKKVLGPSKSCYAAMVANNIKLAYLKKSLVLELLKDPATFEDKILSCFVRVKNDPKDFFFLVKNAYQLGQVTGIKKVQQAYKVGETTTDVVLCISNFSGSIKISMLSDDDIEEEECEDLRQLVRKGLFKPPTVGELDCKIRSVHKDIIHHWIDREIAKLQKQIDRANEKGWRRELNEYIDRRELLRTPEERVRLVEEIPEVTPDMEGEIGANVSEELNLQLENKGNEEPNESRNAPRIEIKDEKSHPANIKHAENLPDILPGIQCENPSFGNEEPRKSRDDQMMEIEIKGEKSHLTNKKPTEIPIIYLDDDDDDDDIGKDTAPVSKENSVAAACEIVDVSMENGTTETLASCDYNTELISKESVIRATVPCDERTRAEWYYIDPSGDKQGPFTLTSLRIWRESGYFEDDFKVWRSGQHETDSILLVDALASAFPDLGDK